MIKAIVIPSNLVIFGRGGLIRHEQLKPASFFFPLQTSLFHFFGRMWRDSRRSNGGKKTKERSAFVLLRWVGRGQGVVGVEGNVSQTDVRRQMFEERVREHMRCEPSDGELHRGRGGVLLPASALQCQRGLLHISGCRDGSSHSSGREGCSGRAVHQFTAGRDKLKASSVRMMTQFAECLTVLFPSLCVANFPAFVNCNVGESVTPQFIST